jgi:hypothetical protein
MKQIFLLWRYFATCGHRVYWIEWVGVLAMVAGLVADYLEFPKAFLIILIGIFLSISFSNVSRSPLEKDLLQRKTLLLMPQFSSAILATNVLSVLLSLVLLALVDVWIALPFSIAWLINITFLLSCFSYSVFAIGYFLYLALKMLAPDFLTLILSINGYYLTLPCVLPWLWRLYQLHQQRPYQLKTHTKSSEIPRVSVQSELSPATLESSLAVKLLGLPLPRTAGARSVGRRFTERYSAPDTILQGYAGSLKTGLAAYAIDLFGIPLLISLVLSVLFGLMGNFQSFYPASIFSILIATSALFRGISRNAWVVRARLLWLRFGGSRSALWQLLERLFWRQQIFQNLLLSAGILIFCWAGSFNLRLAFAALLILLLLQMCFHYFSILVRVANWHWSMPILVCLGCGLGWLTLSNALTLSPLQAAIGGSISIITLSALLRWQAKRVFLRIDWQKIQPNKIPYPLFYMKHQQ